MKQLGEEWDDSLQSKEQIEANLLSKYEATMRRERALAYAFSHQVFSKLLSTIFTCFSTVVNEKVKKKKGQHKCKWSSDEKLRHSRGGYVMKLLNYNETFYYYY